MKNAPIAPKTMRINGHIEPAIAVPVPGSIYASTDVELTSSQNMINAPFIDEKSSQPFKYFANLL